MELKKIFCLKDNFFYFPLKHVLIMKKNIKDPNINPIRPVSTLIGDNSCGDDYHNNFSLVTNLWSLDICEQCFLELPGPNPISGFSNDCWIPDLQAPNKDYYLTYLWLGLSL